jgi:hypothetical protein
MKYPTELFEGLGPPAKPEDMARLEATELAAFNGVRLLGSVVAIHGWRSMDSVDFRRVKRLWRAQCQGGVMVELDHPLHNGSTEVSAAWCVPAGITSAEYDAMVSIKARAP